MLSCCQRVKVRMLQPKADDLRSVLSSGFTVREKKKEKKITKEIILESQMLLQVINDTLI